MSKLTDEHLNDILQEVYGFRLEQWELEHGGGLPMTFARAIESAATEPLLQRIAHLEATASANYGRGHADAHSMLTDRIAEFEANEKVLLAQVQGHTKWREKIVKASEQAYGESAIRYKFSLTKTGKCMNTFPKEIDGRWFALVPAEDDGHIGHIARIAELESENEVLNSLMRSGEQRGVAKGLEESKAQITELERQLEEARKDAERWKMTIEISQDVLRHPDCRKIPSSVSAYMYALHKGYDMTYAVDAAIEAAMQKGQS